MRRRDLFATAGATALFGPAAGRAQTRLPTVGVLVVGSPGSETFWRYFRESMRGMGYVEGQTVHYEFRSDQGEVGRLPVLAAELAALKVDLIVTWFTPAAQAAKEATRDIPIVMALAGDPVETGLVASLARPGGNITGLAGVGAELAEKAIQFVREMLPSGHRIGALANAPDPFAKPFLEHVGRGAAANHWAVDPIPIQRSDELGNAFMAIRRDPPDAVIVQPSLPTTRVAALAMRYRIPAVSVISGFAENGGLMSYETSEADMYRLSALYADKILKGAKPADLPILQPTKFELIFNMKTANAIGLSPPPAFLARADKIIQ